MSNTTTAKKVSAEKLNGLALAVWPHGGGFVVYVNGEILREKKHRNPRVFSTQEAALVAGARAR